MQLPTLMHNKNESTYLGCSFSLVELMYMKENFHLLVVNASQKPCTQRWDHIEVKATNIDAGKDQCLQAPYGKGATFL
jgi:hypothetical protein